MARAEGYAAAGGIRVKRKNMSGKINLKPMGMDVAYCSLNLGRSPSSDGSNSCGNSNI